LSISQAVGTLAMKSVEQGERGSIEVYGRSEGRIGKVAEVQLEANDVVGRVGVIVAEVA
jgi:hypothetical protein